MKKLAPGQERFTVKKIDKLYRVYDRVWGSFPYRRNELGGQVVQDVPEDEAKLECERLNKKFLNPLPVEKKKKPEAAKKPTPVPYKSKAVRAREELLEAEETIQADTFTPAVELTEADIPDYGIMSEEERKKFEEGTVL